ncbi:MAG TPA: hypothetical protein VK448_00075 [Dissulfurispiraceae bacterium]|nr:hypothetical protein [Dissulfurispiraceae bacterium]
MRKLIVIPAIALFLIVCVIPAAAEEMEGYDENTELRIVGQVATIRDAGHGPIIIVVRTMARLYELYTGPAWFWDSLQSGVKANTAVEVIGSKMIGPDGSMRLICRQMKNLETGKVIAFRDDKLVPLWRGGGRHRGSHR